MSANSPSEEIPAPTISVVIPAYQEAGYIDRCIRSLVNGTWPVERLEVLVADGGSTDGTREKVEAWSADCRAVRLVDNPDRFTPQALNRGIRASTGQIVAIMGAHAEADPRWLERVWEDLQAHPEVLGVGGVCETVAQGYAGEAIATAQSSRIGVGQNSFRCGGEAGYADTIVFGAYRRETFVRYGYFDEEMIRNQDDEFNIRLLATGARLWFDPRIQFRYYARSRFSHLWKQYRQYGFWKVRIWQKHGRLGSWRQLIPMMFVAGGLVAAALLPLGGVPAMLGAAYWGLYLLAVAMGSLTAVCAAPALWPGVMLGVMILHAAYGVGFWEGLFRFGLQRKSAAGAHVASTR